MACSNYLKQLALALHNYHDHAREFPPEKIMPWQDGQKGRGTRGGDVLECEPGGRGRWDAEPGNWEILLLPFIEEGPKFDLVNWDIPYNRGVNYDRVFGVEVAYPLFVCPSNPVNNALVSGQLGWNWSGQTAVIHYYAVLGGVYANLPPDGQTLPGPVKASPTGYQNPECNRQTNGMFHQVTGVRMAEATDGTSTTALLCEAWGYEPQHDRVSPHGPGGCEPSLPGVINLQRICDGRGIRISAFTKFDYSNPNGRRGREYEGRVDRWFTAGSFHPRGLHVAMSDGGVQFWSDTIDWSVYNALGTKDGAETFITTNGTRVLETPELAARTDESQR
jgi:hypothetical protein